MPPLPPAGMMGSVLFFATVACVESGFQPLPSRAEYGFEAFMKVANKTTRDKAPNVKEFPNVLRGFSTHLDYVAAWELTDRPRKMALLVDDMQNEYTPFIKGIIPQVQDLLAAFRDKGFPIFWSTWWRFGPHDGFFNAQDRFYGPVGTKTGFDGLYLYTPNGGEVIPDIGPITLEEKKRYFHKRYSYDNFDERPMLWAVPDGQGTLNEEMSKLGVDTVVLVGAWTDACITATAFSALGLHYDMLVVEDGVSTATKHHEFALDTMRGSVAKLMMANDVVDYARNHAVLPEEADLATSLAERRSIGRDGEAHQGLPPSGRAAAAPPPSPWRGSSGAAAAPMGLASSGEEGQSAGEVTDLAETLLVAAVGLGVGYAAALQRRRKEVMPEAPLG